MRDQYRERLGRRAFQILMGVDRDDPFDVDGIGDIDVDDPRMRVRRPDERHLEGVGVGPDVVGVPAVAGYQAEVLDAADGFADVPGDHYCPPA